MDCSAKVGVGLPVAATVKAFATPEVAPSGPGLALKDGGVSATAAILYKASFCWAVV